MQAWKTQLLTQIKTIFEDDNFEEIMLEVITNQLGKVEWSSVPKQHGGSKLGQFNNIEKDWEIGHWRFFKEFFH
jgi:hypothetical protein